LGAFGLSPGAGSPGGGPPGFGASPGGVGAFSPSPTPPPKPDQNRTGVILKDDDEDEAGAADYSIDASMVFSASALLKNNSEAEALQKRLALLFEISQDMGSESS